MFLELRTPRRWTLPSLVALSATLAVVIPSLAGASTPGRSAGIHATVQSAFVNFAALAQQEAQAKALTPQTLAPQERPLIREEDFENEMDEEPGANLVGAPSMFSAPPPFTPFVASPTPVKSYIGLDDIAMADSNYIVIPPDVGGAVGPTKVMNGHNNNYRILDKATGATQLTVGTATFWAPVISDKTLLNKLTDPRTEYDPIQNRWIVAMQTVNQNGLILFGVSQTSDPAAGWYLYAVQLNTTSGNYLIDFPTLGFNKNWVCVSINRYTTTGAFNRGEEIAADYSAARSGTLSSVTEFDSGLNSGLRFCAAPCQTISATEDTLFLPTHLSSGGASFQVDVITGTPSAPVYTAGAVVVRPGGGWTQPSGNQLPQSAPVSGASVCGATPCAIEAQDSQIRSAPTYRVDSTTGRGYLYYTQSIRLTGPSRNSVQWTKLTPGGGGTNPAFADGGRIDDATAANWYSYPHIAVNALGDFIIGYSRFGSTQHPSAGYSVHIASEGLGTLRDAFVYRAGDDYYHKTFTTNTGRNRWGDFSTAQVDPSDDRTLWVLQEYAKTRATTNDGTTGSNASKWSTWWAAVATYRITASAGTGGSINPNGIVTVNSGASQSFTITPSAGYMILDVLVDGSSVGAVSSYTFNNVTSDHTIAASFGTSTLTPVSPTVCVTPAACVTVPFNISRSDLRPMLAYHAVFHLSANVALCAGTSSITEGTYMNASHSTTFQTVDNGGGSYTADGATLGFPCGVTTASGNLFNISLKNVNSGPFSVVLDSFVVRDCSNNDLPTTKGGPATGTADNAPVSVASIPNQTVAEASPLTVTPSLTTTACATAPINWTVTGLPPGAAFNTGNGVVTWTPACDAFENGPDYGPVTVTAHDAIGNTGSASYSIHVNNTPGSVTVTVASPPASDELTPITVTPSGSIGPCTTGPLTWSIAPPLPSGASFDPSSGVVNWTPSCGQAGSYGPFTLTATAASGETGTGSFSLTVNHKTGTVTVSVSDPPATDELSTITVTPSAVLTSCAAGGPSWSISPAVPSGASFDPVTGVFNWTPSCGQAGTYGPFTLTATATTGESGTGSFSVTVNHKVGTVAVGPISDPTVAEEATLTVAPTATLTSCAATPLAWTGTIPAGATLNSSSGELNWTPDCHAFENGPDYPVTLTATAATGEFGSVSFTIHVTNTSHVLTAIADLAAQQVKSGNDADGTTKIKITYTAPSGANAVDVYRVGYGHYPLYDDGGGAAPTAPVTPPGPPWVLTGVTASGQSDEVTTRDFYYYVAFARTTCGDVSPVSDLTGGTLNYHLGDVTDGITPGQGDNLVQIEDISLLGSHYGATGATLIGYEYLDVGPTTDHTVDARPTTDGKVGFEDLVMFAINYHVVSGPTGMKPVATNTQDVVSLQVTSPSPDRLVAHVILNGSGACQAIATLLAWNPDVLEPIGSGLGTLGEEQHGVAMSAAPGDVDVAMLGLRGQGFTGLGELATVTFHIKGEGAYGLAIKATQGRTPSNQDAPVLINSTTAVNVVAPSATAFAAPSPNPFGVSTALSFSLAKPGAVGLEIYSVDGRRVRTLVRGAREAGEYREVWDGRDEAGAQVGVGIYYARLTTAQGTFHRKLVRMQ